MKKIKNAFFKHLKMLPFYIWLFIFIIFPVILIFSYSIKSGDSLSISNYVNFFNKSYLSVLVRSLKLAFFATVICLILAYPLAIILSDEDKKKNPVWFLLFIAPMWMNFLIRTLAWRSILDDSGIINVVLSSMGLEKISFLGGDGAILTGMVYDLLPFMLFPIYSSISKIEKNILEASHDLGANWFSTLRHIILPLSMPGVLSGITMVFVPSVTTFVFTQYLANGKGMLIGDLIEQQFGRVGDWNFGSALSVLVMSIILLCMYFINKLGGDEEVNVSW